MKSKKFLLTLIIYLSSFNFTFSMEADVFVQSTVNRASKILGNNISKEEKIQKLKIIAKETVDINGIGLYTLGSERKNQSENDLKKYHELFEDYTFLF